MNHFVHFQVFSEAVLAAQRQVQGIQDNIHELARYCCSWIMITIETDTFS